MYVDREVKRFLLGRIVVENELLYAEPDTKMALLGWQGPLNGSVSSVLLGISRRERTYKVDNSEEAYENFAYYLAKIGRLALFLDHPDILGCFRRNGMGNVVLYASERDLYGENTMTLTVFTARGVFSGRRIRQAFRRIENLIGDIPGIDIVDENTIREIKKERNQEEEKSAAEEKAEMKEKKEQSFSQNRRVR